MKPLMKGSRRWISGFNVFCKKEREGMPELKRSLGVLGAASVSIGAIIGAGIFVLIGVSSGLAGPSVILSFMIAGVVSFLTALSSAELASFITESGGSYIYTHKAFGKFWGYLVGWMQSFDYIVGASAVSIGFAAYFTYFLGIQSAQTVIVIVGSLLPLVLMLVNFMGVKEASGTNNLLVGLKVTALVLFIIVGGSFLISNGDYSNYHPFFPTGVAGMLSGAAIIFFAFAGFNTITVIAEEVKNPEKNVPKAIMLAFALCTLLYIGVSLVSVGLVSWKLLGASDTPLEAALKTATDNVFLLKFISVSALFATASVVMASILGGSRALFAMARQRVIPVMLARISKNGVPTFTVMLSGVVIALIVVVSQANLDWLASIFNFGTLMTYFFINLSVVRLRQKMPDANRTFRVPFYPVIPVLGVLSCFALAFYLNPNAIVFAAAWIAIGIAAYEYNKRREAKT
ncbi:MAG: amino acid permease [Candidatus Methanoperedens sp.]|nr:amino acid permease [Candidatus Methanoperedens sp.]